MKTIGALIFALLFSSVAFAVKLDCKVNEKESYRLDFSPVDSTALLFSLPLKAWEQGATLEVTTNEDETLLVFMGKYNKKTYAFAFDFEAFYLASSTGKIDGSLLTAKGDAEFDTEVEIHCEK